MTAADIVARLREHGHRVALEGAEIVIRPRPDAETIAQIGRCRADVVEILQQLPLASEHRYVVWSGAVDRSRGVCIACGKPPCLHGAGALESALVVDEPNEVALIEARAIVAAVAAQAAS